MKRLIMICVIIVMLGVLYPASGAIYEANFDAESLGPLSTQPNTDPLPLHLPTHIIRDLAGTVNVVASAGDLLNQPVLLDSVPGGLASVAFYNPSEYSSGAYRISWDSLVLSMPVDTRSEQGNVHIVQLVGGSLQLTWGLKYNTDSSFLIRDLTGYHSVGSFSVATSDHFDLYLDLDSSVYELYINSASALTGSLIGPGEFLHTYFRSNGRGSAMELAPFAFDNLEIVPIPGAFLLGILGLSVAGLKLRKHA